MKPAAVLSVKPRHDSAADEKPYQEWNRLQGGRGVYECVCFVEGGCLQHLPPPTPFKEPSRTLWPDRSRFFFFLSSFLCVFLTLFLGGLWAVFSDV